MASRQFNFRQIKRQAHLAGRSSPTWLNPFGHTWKKGSEGRRETWDGAQRREADVEAYGTGGILEDGEGSPITHANTVPARFPPYEEKRNNAGASSKDDEMTDAEKTRSQQEQGSNNSQQSTTTAVETHEGLRARGKEQTALEARDGEDTSKKKKDVKQSRWFKSVQPKDPFTVRNQIWRTVFNSWINILLLAAPAGIALGFVPNMNGIIVFVINFIAIVPLAALLSFATEEIALRTGETLGGLLNATFGNAVELIVAIIALVKGEVVIVQTSLIGSILSNLLLVMGMCFFFGGLNRPHQNFNTTVAQTAASLLALAVAGVIVPTVFDANSSTPLSDVASLSRGTSVILLVVYGGYLFFQLHTHHEVFAQESVKVPKKRSQNSLQDGAIHQGLVRPAGLMHAYGLSQPEDHERMRDHIRTPIHKDEEDEGEEPQLHFLVALATLTISTVIIALCAEFMVDGISAVTAGGVVREEFVGLILLPIVGNAAEHATAVTVAIKDKMDLAIGVAVGSSMQVALFIIPLLVVIGWGMHMDDMSLSFDVFQVAVLFVSVLLVNYLIADGKSHWLEGMLLMSLYCIVAVCSWWYPSKICTTAGQTNCIQSSNNGTSTS